MTASANAPAARPAGLRVALDATPLLGQPTGVGRYTAELMAALLELSPGERPDALLAAAFTWRGHAELTGRVPEGVIPAGRRVPARLLQNAWLRAPLPSMPMLGVRADVVHGTNFVLPPPGRGRAGVVTVHDLSYLRLPETVTAATARYRRLVPRAVHRAALVLTPSQAIADEVASEYRLSSDRVRATPLGVHPAWFDAAALPRPPGLPERYLLFVGTLEPRKDLPTLLTAYRRLRSAAPDVPPLVLCGPAGWGPALDTAGLSADDVVQLGYLDAQALRPVVAGAALLCFPSRYEGFGLPPLEALAAGTPVVASDIPAVREMVGAAGAGVSLVTPRDPDALAGAISDALDAAPNPAPGRSYARRFTWHHTAVRTAQAYRDAVT